MIEAAGGVVLRGVNGTTQVLVVRRPRHADWSLPKGKLDPGEAPRAAAVREVREETGVEARPERELGSHVYTVRGTEKRVRWYLMAPVEGDPSRREPDDEIERAVWWSIDEALRELTYERDRALLLEAHRRWQP